MITVAVLGATGYTALEAIKILLRHPQAKIVAVTSRQEGKTPISSVHPSLVGRLDLPLEDLSPEEVGGRAQCVFGCLPHCANWCDPCAIHTHTHTSGCVCKHIKYGY